MSHAAWNAVRTGAFLVGALFGLVEIVVKRGLGQPVSVPPDPRRNGRGVHSLADERELWKVGR